MRTLSRLRLPISQTLWLAVLTGASISYGGSLGVSPIRIDLSKSHPTAVLRLENQSDSVKTYQIETRSWTQEGGEDRYLPTRELITVPPLFTLKPRQTQIVRIGVKRGAETREIAYRLFVQELPIDQMSDQAGSPPMQPGIRTLLRVGIPVFLAPLQRVSKPDLLWQAEKSESGVTSLIVENRSALHVQIGRVKLGREDEVTLALYILPGQKRRWNLPYPVRVSGESIGLRAETDQGLMAHDAAVLTQ